MCDAPITIILLELNLDPLPIQHKQGMRPVKLEEWGYTHPAQRAVPQWHEVRCLAKTKIKVYESLEQSGYEVKL